MVAHDGTTDCQTPSSLAKLDALASLPSGHPPERIAALEQLLMADLVETLKQAIVNSEMSRYEIARRAGVSQAIISRFVNGERGIKLETAGKLASVLGLSLTATPPQQERRKQRG